MDARILAFLGISLLLTITPGADMALVTKNTLRYGRQAALMSSLGISAAVAVHGLASASGLSVILSRSALAFSAVKWVGALYLIYLGVRALLPSRQTAASATAAPAVADPTGPRHALRSFGEGFLTNALNPKVALFYLTFLPQFIGPGEAVLQKSMLLAGIHIVLGLIWLNAYARLLEGLGAFIARPGVKRSLDRLTGVVLIGFGVRLAWEKA